MGYVYLLKSNKKDTLKIGKTANLEQRMKSFYTCSKHLGIEDETFEFIHTIKVDKYDKLETLLHKKFKDKRVCGEWFNITKEEFISMLESIDLKQFSEVKTSKVNNELPFYIDNYVSINELFKGNAFNYNYDIENKLALDPWIERTDYRYYGNKLYVNIEDIPFLCDGIWYMVKRYYQRRYFREFTLYPILDKLHLVLTYYQILDLFLIEGNSLCEDELELNEEILSEIESWRNFKHK